MKRCVLWVFAWCLLASVSLVTHVDAQSFMSEAQSNGFTLKKVVSDTAIASGQNFSYTIYFSIPAGATNVTITDVLPAATTFQAISVTSACGTPVTTTPAVGTSGTVTLSWASVPSGCSGSFVITVQFPNGITCNGTSARNRACMTASLNGTPIDFCTGFISTTAQAVNPWTIGKWVTGVGTQPGPCPYVTADSVVTYQVCVYKNVGVTGQLNMFNAVVYDTLPAGAQLVSSSCGATQTGNVVTWNIGNLSAIPMFNTVCCTFSILYPRALFPNGSQLLNRATLQGTLGSPNAPCGPAVHTSPTTCVEVKSVTSATFSKFVNTTGQPGCTGKYSIWLCNNGSTTISALTITDTIPAALTGISLGTVSSGLTATLVGNVVTVTLSSPLPPNTCRYFEVNFTIPASATVGSVINNCAYLNIVGMAPMVACAPFTVTAPAPKPCVWKEVCNKQTSYTPGSIFRYRLRVQNIGGLPITGATITDVLNPNLQYIGNPSYYSASSWNTPCSNTSNWAGVGLTQAGNTLTFTLPSIPASCQNIFYGACGMYGAFGVPFYYIEFDVKVVDTSALGNIPNSFTISGGNIGPSVNSNIDYVNVVGTTGFVLDKAVAKDTTSWASSVSTSAGSNVNYRLRLTVAPGSVGLRHVTFADLLPRDNAPNDNLILGPCSPRGSAFNVGFNAPILTSPLASPYRNATSFSNVNIFAPSGAPGPMFTSGCGTMGSWATGMLPLDRNLGWYFGSTPIPAGNSATSMFTATVAPGAQDNAIACNTFAANGAVRHLINSSVISDQATGNLESGTACVTVKKDSTGCYSMQLQGILNTGVDASGNCTYDVIVAINNPGAPVTGSFQSFSGNVIPASMTIPSGTTIDTLTFVDTPPTDIFACIRYGYQSATGATVLCDSVCFDLPPCGGSDPCDSLRAQVQSINASGVNSSGHCTYTVTLAFNNTSSSPISTWFESFQGAVTPAIVNVPVGSSTQTFTFTDTPPTDVFACIRFGYFAQGIRVVCDSVCFDVPPCGGTTDPCDSLDVKVGSVTSTGVNSSGDCTYSVTLNFTNASIAAIPLWFESFQGTVAPPTASIPVGNSTQTFTFTDTPPTDVFACIRYGYFSQGIRVVCDSVCFDLPPCDSHGDLCDSLDASVKSISTAGVDAAGNCTYTVSVSVNNASANPMFLSFNSLQGTVSPAALTVPTGSSTQTLTFTDTPPVNSFACIRIWIATGPPPMQPVLCDSICFDLTPCASAPCDSLIKAEVDTACCDYQATIVNGPGTPITSISYTITGGTLSNFITMPCMPVTPPAVGSTSGVLTYSPACPGNLQFMFQANPNTPSNTVFVTLVVHHGKDSCVLRFQYTCDRTPLIRCDDIKVKPFVTNILQLSGRSFTIFNNKVPASPITYVTVTPVPTPCNVIGGALQVDLAPTTWSVPYNRIPNSGFISANTSVSFNLAIPYSCAWTGNVQIVVHHADGDSCLYTYGPWKAALGIGTGVVVTDPIKDRVYANKLRLRNTGTTSPVKWISVNVEAATDVIIAGSGAHWEGTTLRSGYEKLEGYQQGATEGLFTFDHPVQPGASSEYFNIVVARDSAAPGTPVIRWTTYDEEGNALATDTVGITTSVLSVRSDGTHAVAGDFQLLHAFPNPAAHNATINYMLGNAMDVRLELYNQLGERVAEALQGTREAGLHSTRIDVSGLASGTYILRLATPGGFVTRPLRITR